MLQGIELRRNLLKLYFGSQLVGFLLGSLLLFVLSLLQRNGIIRDSEFTVATVGTMISLVIFWAIYVFVGMTEFGAGFSRYIGFGMTRKSFFVQEFFTSYLFMALSVLLLAILKNVEQLILKIPFYSQFTYEELFTKKIWSMILLISFICAPLVRIFLGSLMLKFKDQKGFWILWALWMIGCMAPGYINDIMKEGPKGNIQTGIYHMVSACMKVPGNIWIVAAVVACAAVLLISWRLISRETVG